MASGRKAKKTNAKARQSKKIKKRRAPALHRKRKGHAVAAKRHIAHKKTVVKEAAGAGEERTRSTRSRREAIANAYTPEEIRQAIEELSANDAVLSYLKKNVSKRAMDVINQLVAPKTDEALAQELDMKINAVRRILNLMQGMGITNYYIAKNVNGWLSFAWYINVSKLPPFYEYINSIENKKPAISGECNDYFICKNCYEASKLIFTFDAAFEESFRCGSCGKGLVAMDKEQATKLLASNRFV